MNPKFRNIILFVLVGIGMPGIEAGTRRNYVALADSRCLHRLVQRVKRA